MSEYIDRAELYKKVSELEELARQRVVDTPTSSPAYMRYVTQLTERTAMKQMIFDEPAATVAHVVYGRWTDAHKSASSCKCSVCGAVYAEETNFCPKCGARMDKEEK